MRGVPLLWLAEVMPTCTVCCTVPSPDTNDSMTAACSPLCLNQLTAIPPLSATKTSGLPREQGSVPAMAIGDLNPASPLTAQVRKTWRQLSDSSPGVSHTTAAYLPFTSIPAPGVG